MKRVPELDALRGCAATAIVLFHYSYPSRLYDKFFYIGKSSLELFFVLSGYLITSIILDCRGTRSFLPRFYARRSLRIWPIYYLTLGVVVFAAFARPGLFPLDGWPYYLAYLQNVPLYWSGPNYEFAYPFRLTWSLAIEEQFYILWPALVLAVGRRRVVPLALALMVTAVAARLYGFSDRLLLARCDGFALGGLLAALLGDPEQRRTDSRALRIGFAVAAFAALNYLTWGLILQGEPPFVMEGPAASVSIFAVAALFFGVIGLVVCHAGGPATSLLRARWLCYLGAISYGIYLYHNLILIFFAPVAAKLGVGNWYAARALAAVVVLAVASLSWRFVERPILALKDRFRYDPAPTGPVDTSRAGPDGPDIPEPSPTPIVQGAVS